MAINLNDGARNAAAQLAHAFQADDETQITEAFLAMQVAIGEDVAAQYREAAALHDDEILARRGFPQLTQRETEYFGAIIDALGSPNPRQALATIAEGDNSVPGRMMPETVIDEILKDIEESHPLLGMLGVTNVGYVTTWLRNKHTRQLAVWGEVETAITQEIKSAFEVVQVTQGKLSCFAAVSRDMLELGPRWLAGYVRTVLGEAMACGMESGVVSGKGAGGEPVGLDRNIKGSYSKTTGYPAKSATKITSFDPTTYGALVAQLAKTDDDRNKRSVGDLTLICNLKDRLTKIMPATTVLNTSGQYVGGLFPVPTRVVDSEFVPEGRAILCLPSEYELLVGGNRGIEYSDEYQFLEDNRVFKVVTYAYGEPRWNTTALLLDISKLDPAYVTVKTVATAATGEDDG